eukprot:CAMPEP_0119263018 /NCGR_PEP_ID=MMETSP1329-20130426/2555_1 /TAXON_ID=114041 /ORGANISM="Genus nov. species nov., Strain RCC1024" /LENGTH=72 /DNA_ID=CAMNT_0007262707 /DNA_START=11 /DNA_END=226 /DNA_ORIENTATION=+
MATNASTPANCVGGSDSSVGRGGFPPRRASSRDRSFRDEAIPSPRRASRTRSFRAARGEHEVGQPARAHVPA